MVGILRCAIGSCLLLAATVWAAESSYPFAEYARQVHAAQGVEAVGEAAFGEAVNPYSGGTEFTAVDIDLPGNDALPVRLGRRFAVEDRFAMKRLAGFGDWDLEVPYVEASVEANAGWSVASASSPDRWKRCSLARAPLVERSHFVTEEVFTGIVVNLPGAPRRELMRAIAGAYGAPADGQAYPWTTRELDRARCLPSLRNGYPGEGFVLATPDGLRYTFDWGAERTLRSLRKGPTPSLVLDRKRVYLLATRVEDRFGNWVAWKYTGDRLSAVEASDGRRIDIAWSGEAIASATAIGRTWRYEYDAGALRRVVNPDGSSWGFAATGELHPVVAPGLMIDPFAQSEPDCVTQQPDVGGAFVYAITHPAGATGTFRFSMHRHYRTQVPYGCAIDVMPQTLPAQATVVATVSQWDESQFQQLIDEGVAEHDAYLAAWVQSTQFLTLQSSQTVAGYLRLVVPNYFDVYALDGSTVTGPGLDPANTTYDYGEVFRVGFCNYRRDVCLDCPVEGECTLGGKWVRTTRPDGSVLRRRFGVRYGIDDGRLLQEQVLAADGAVLRDTGFAYVADADVAAQPFAANVGGALSRDPMASKVRPLLERTIVQQGATFRRRTHAFDAFARPLSQSRASSLGFAATDALEYHDDAAQWVLGQERARRTDGIEVVRHEFDALARNVRTFRHGQLQSTLAWRADGTLASRTDALGRASTFSDWHRGVPRTIVNADGTRRTATVNEAGWVTSITDENGWSTTYTHDAVGRIASTTPPAGDTVEWLPTITTFAAVAAPEYGLGAGHWRRVAATGNRRQATYYDGLWRPVLEHEYDASDIVRTQRFRAWRYDPAGRLAFTADPTAAATSLASFATGTAVIFDALGRPLRTDRDSELGVLATKHAYESGFRTRTTNPRGIASLTSWQAFDEPVTDAPLRVVEAVGRAEERVTEIVRDRFGKPLAITRSGLYLGAPVTAVRRYVYDAQQRLCKAIHPDIGTDVYAYDAAGELAWSAPGTTLTANACDRDAAPTSLRIVRATDARGRPVTQATPDGTGSLAWTYTPDGLVASVAATNAGGVQVVTDFTYNRRRLLVSETLTQPGATWRIKHSYNAAGDASWITYPNGVAVGYAPDALGRPRVVGEVATDIQWHPDGTLARFTYGNGIVHTTTRNARGLPVRREDRRAAGALLDDRYTWDEAGNLLDLEDGARTGFGSRSMGYDSLDRLTAAVAPSLWGNALWTHDPFDNLRSAWLGDSLSKYQYDDSQRLVTLARGGGGSYAYATDARGNITGDGRQAYRYDLGNRLLGVTGKEDYRYDGQGRRTLVQRATTKALSMYDAAGHLRYVQDTRRGLRVATFWLGDRAVAEVAQPIAGGATTTTYLHTDALGSPVARTDASQAVLERRDYAPFGLPLDAGIDGLAYTGHAMDLDTNLVYAQQRYYDPALGRFISPDPVKVDSVMGENFSRYAYADNNPYRFVDPDGRANIPVCERPVPIPPPPPLSLPTRLGEVTSRYGYRVHPVTGQRQSFHNGTDFRAFLNHEIRSTQNGTVASLTSGGPGGNTIMVRNRDGSLSGYAHTKSSDGLKVGDVVASGQVIGRSDGSGRIRGAHLHYTYRPGTPDEPATVRTPTTDPVETQLKPLMETRP